MENNNSYREVPALSTLSWHPMLEYTNIRSDVEEKFRIHDTDR